MRLKITTVPSFLKTKIMNKAQIERIEDKLIEIKLMLDRMKFDKEGRILFHNDDLLKLRSKKQKYSNYYDTLNSF